MPMIRRIACFLGLLLAAASAQTPATSPDFFESKVRPVLATNCYCFYTDDKGPNANPVGALWRVLPADKVPAGVEVAKAKGN